MSQTFVQHALDANEEPVNLKTGDGRNNPWKFIAKDTGGNVINITGFTLIVLGKNRPTDTDAQAVFTTMQAPITITSAVDGEFNVDFTSLNLTSEARDFHLLFRRTVAGKDRDFGTVKTHIQAN